MTRITWKRTGSTIEILSDGDVIERYNWRDADVASARFQMLRAEAKKQAAEFNAAVQRAADFRRG